MSQMVNAVGASAAVDSLEQLFVKANNDLTVVQHKLEIESEQRYPDKSRFSPSKVENEHYWRGSSGEEDLRQRRAIEASRSLHSFQASLNSNLTYPLIWKNNPLKLMYRIKKIQEELPLLKEQCEKLLAAKQDLIDKTQTMLVGNRALIQRLQVRTNIPVINDSDDPLYTSLEKIIDEWNEQLGLKSNEIGYDNGFDALRDLNQKLFNSKIQNS